MERAAPAYTQPSIYMTHSHSDTHKRATMSTREQQGILLAIATGDGCALLSDHGVWASRSRSRSTMT